MEDCVMTTQIVDGVHHTFYSKDGAVIAECRITREYGENVERWFRRGRLHREDGPAIICYNNGRITSEYWYRNGKRHRDDGPASICYENGKIISEYWYHDGKLHRDDGPASIWYKDGQITNEYWVYNDALHRVNGPAKVLYNNGKTTEEWWFRDDKLCPIGVLASIIYHGFSSRIGYLTKNLYAKDADEFRDIVKGDAIHEALRALPIPIRQAIILHYCYQ
jgi:hypothetical protein